MAYESDCYVTYCRSCSLTFDFELGGVGGVGGWVGIVGWVGEWVGAVVGVGGWACGWVGACVGWAVRVRTSDTCEGWGRGKISRSLLSWTGVFGFLLLYRGMSDFFRPCYGKGLPGTIWQPRAGTFSTQLLGVESTLTALGMACGRWRMAVALFWRRRLG